MIFLKYKNWKISYYIFQSKVRSIIFSRSTECLWRTFECQECVMMSVCDESVWRVAGARGYEECMWRDSELRDTCHILSWHTLVTDSHQRHPSHTLVTDTRHTLSSHTLVIHSRHRYSLHTLLTHICRIFHIRNSSHTLITDNHHTLSSQLFIAHSRHRHLSHTLVIGIHCTLSS